MKNTLINVLMFATGAAIGSVVTWKLVKTKYERLADEEIESVKEVYSRQSTIGVEPEEVESNEDPVETPKVKIAEKPDIMEYAAKLKEEGYMDYSNQAKPEKKEEKLTRDMDDLAYDEEPFVIAPEHFDEYDDFEAISLTYWADGFLTDEDDNLIEDIDGTVGLDYDEHFGEFEDDSVFIRNERLKTDFEILAVEGNYKDTIRSAKNMEG